MWSTTALATTFVSATQLKATVPDKLTNKPGTFKITVTNPSPGGTSNALNFTVGTPSLTLVSATPTRTGGTLKVDVALKNGGNADAASVVVTKATLGGKKSTTTPLPHLAAVRAGETVHLTLAFPGAAGPAHKSAAFQLAGTFAGGKFKGSQTLRLP